MKTKYPALRPVHLMSTKGVEKEERLAVKSAIKTALKIGGVEKVVKIKDFGYWNQGPGPYMSIDWYIEQAKKPAIRTFQLKDKGKGKQIDARKLIAICGNEPWRFTGPRFKELVKLAGEGKYEPKGSSSMTIQFDPDMTLRFFRRLGEKMTIQDMRDDPNYFIEGEDIYYSPHYDVIVVDYDLNDSNENLNFIIGLSNKADGKVRGEKSFRHRGFAAESIISVKRFRDIKPVKKRLACLKTLALHEFGHIIHAARGREGVEALTSSRGKHKTLYQNHCANECVMRQGNRVPKSWIKMTDDRLDRADKGKPSYCKECIRDIKKFFRQKL